MKAKTILNLVACFLLSYGAKGLSQTIYFDTGTASEWSVTGGGAQNATPFIVNYAYGTPSTYYNFLSVTTTGDSTGSFLQGGSLANFTGFWVADYTFTLPANAMSVSLNFNNFYADDRAVLTLNGQAIAATGIISIQGAPGSMVFTDGGNPVSYAFSGLFSSGTVTSGFNIGGLNTIQAIINNTGTGIYGLDRSLSPGDDTFLGLSGTISYLQVPEPSSLSMFGLGILSIIGLLKRK